ncbi:MAG TPA: HEAT repeat domain-containing protein [Leptospiraceae bacterium]|nr:HEAT repeat domain-containing protein [Leptospiraceae bacterium]HMW07335.1 HEAT repeat domain-containing protein [Leptospiraceae bacterium]HMX33391.1 HEAT repeat domain-containing protein [Leptospiraceae bacterium]HMY32957.1 HEAT repeat domain-containing protein [Leptospiraceae bacterium]HMZ64571.1 HEAT repeat domain-containing protein [Leptospiraceae bacterium]
MLIKLLFLFLISLISCKGPDKPDTLPTIKESPMKTKEEIKRDLKSTNFYERSQALVEIGKLKEKEFIPEIKQLLKKDPNPAVRGSAALCLAELEDKSSTLDIIDLFKDKDISTDVVLDALTRMKDPQAIPSIIPVLDSSDHTHRLLAVEALTQIGSTNGTDKIITMASANKDIEKAKTYAMVIGKLKLVKGENILLQLADTTEASPTLAATYLALGRIKSKKSVPILAKAIGKDFDKGRENSILSLKEIGDTAANPLLIDYLKNKNKEIQMGAADVISTLYDLKTAENVAKLLESSDKSVFAPSAYILGRYKYEPSRKKIEAIATDKSNPDREIITQSLGWLQNKESIPVLKQILQEKEGEGRYGAAWSLGMLGAEDAIDLLEEAANSRDNKLARIAIESLGQIQSPKSLSFLSKKIETNKELSSSILASIASIPGQEATKVLDKYALSTDSVIQRSALQAILQRKDKENIPVLIKILEENKGADTASFAQLALRGITGENFSSRNEWINWFYKKK